MPVTSGFTQWAEDHADVMRFLTDPNFDTQGSRFLRDMMAMVGRRQALSPAQVDAVRRNIARTAARQAASTEDGTGRGVAPTGRVTVEGTVTGVDDEPGYRREIDHKMTVDTGEYVVRCTVPAALVALHQTGGLVGRRLRMNATLTSAPATPWRAVGKAPRGVELVNTIRDQHRQVA